jgi:tetratricopeptide (TPR) repeat protein
MRRIRSTQLLWLAVPVLILLGWLVYQIPAVQVRLSWRLELARTYVRGVIDPVKPLPTSKPQPTHTPGITPSPTISLTPPPPTPTSPGPTETPLPSPTPIPPSVALAAPEYVKQDPNNCGPASLAMYLNYFGWAGTQGDIAQIVKPLDADRNVNPDELAYYVRNYAGWLKAEFRVGGDIDLLKRLLAAGIPVTIEESFIFDEAFWPNDDLWAAHYLLLTGYDEPAQTFTAQDSFHGPNQKVSYAALDAGWKIFNRVYFLVYLPDQENTVKAILEGNWDEKINRERAQAIAQAEILNDPQDAFAWFNVGSNQVYFERYAEAAEAYDKARDLGLPQRMLRYQFGPFLAYFHAGRMDDLMALVDYALQRTPNAEEALVWKGWGLYRQGDTIGAVESFREALKANPTSTDAQYGLDFLGAAR